MVIVMMALMVVIKYCTLDLTSSVEVATPHSLFLVGHPILTTHLGFLIVILLDLEKDGVLKHHLVPPLVGLIHVDSVDELL